MPDIEDIIENLAPFAFVLIWVLSAIFGRSREQPPAKTSKPIFAPPIRDNKNSNLGSKRESSSPWEDFDAQSDPFSDPDFAPVARSKPADVEDPAEKLRRLLKVRAKQAKKSVDSEPSTTIVVQGLGESSASVFKKPESLKRLVADRSSEVHLERALTDRAPSAASPSLRKSGGLGSLKDGLRDRESIRKAFLMSIILAEPRSKRK